MLRTIFQCYLFAGPQPGEDDYGGAEPEEAAGDPEEDRLLEAHRHVGHVRVPQPGVQQGVVAQPAGRGMAQVGGHFLLGQHHRVSHVSSWCLRLDGT